MVRGFTWFRCPCCGTTFMALDIEANATVESMPAKCPKCGTMSPRSPGIGLLGWLGMLIDRIRH